ncbi:hypothetical protein LTR53_012925 [Teratosphaeriaceae sp. CCFEE 6253]|nr:hypothetical protein LTR53_012925 [Teratosphaeriaceae sp. CCFEE 6253]
MEAAVRWSPHSTANHRRFLVVDVSESSLTLNEVQDDGKNADSDLHYRPVTRYTKLPSFNAFAWSPTQEPLVALGLVSGNTSLIRLGEGQHRPSETLATFKVKQQRKCNAVALSRQDWLAVALDKTRSDVCLSIYDTNADLKGEPIRKLCAAELASSVRFFAGSPQEVVACTQRAFVRVYDLRDGYFGAGGSSSSSLQAATRHVNNLAIDPQDEHCFASAGSTGDPTLTIWDKRWMTSSPYGGSNSGAVLSLSLAGKSTSPMTIHSLRWSGSQRGRLAVSTSDGEVKVIDVKGHSSVMRDVDYVPVNPYGGASWQGNRYVAQTRTLSSIWHGKGGGGDGDMRAIAFDWINNSDGPDSAGQKMIVLQPDREAKILTIPSINAEADITSRGDFAVRRHDQFIVEANHLRDRSESPLGTARAPQNDDAQHPALIHALDSPALSRLLSSSMTQRDRCRQGYLFDCAKNASLVADNAQLSRLWETLRGFRARAANNGMVHREMDLSYIGAAGLWFEQIRHAPSPSTTSTTTTTTVADAIAALTTSHNLPAFDGQRTDFPEHRQLGLVVCGWRFTPETLEAECRVLISRGAYYQAVVQAVLHDATPLALTLLRDLTRNRTLPNIGLAALLASPRPLNAEQRKICRDLTTTATEHDDNPALKAVLTFLSTGDWRDVMKLPYLHLEYRVALALKYLNDTELSGFLATETARAVRKGDLEGVLLTGLRGGQGMDLLQGFVARTGDVQSAVLAGGFTQSGMVGDGDVRWGVWREAYYEQMQGWRAFNERTRFTVQHARLHRDGRVKDGGPVVPTQKARVLLRCNHCQSPLTQPRAAARSSANGHAATSTSTSGLTTKLTGPAAHAGTVCPTCRRHLPRCALCLLWLGTPPPTPHASMVAGVGAGKQKEDGAGGPEARLEGMLTFCLRCVHGYHAHHAREWFGRPGSGGICAVPGCGCACGL